jgi:hypothetical protein
VSSVVPITVDVIHNLPLYERNRALERYHAWIKEQRKKDKAAVRSEALKIRRVVDPEYRRRENAAKEKYRLKRYNSDAAFREKCKAAAKEFAARQRSKQ